MGGASGEAIKEGEMDEVKIWAIGDSHAAEPLESKSQVETEALLEETLVRNPDLLIRGLKLVGRQTPTEGGPLDLLGVDTDGRLVVFELKRGTLSRDAVAQVVDYASDLDTMELTALAEYISDRSGEHGIENIEDFQKWYSRDFGELESLKPLRLFLVGLGTDDRTERMVRFLADNSNMDISMLTFHGFVHDGKTLLAKQVEVEGAAELDRSLTRRRVSLSERRKRLERQIEESGVSDIFDAAKEMFEENWPGSSTRPGVHGLGIRLKGPRGWSWYARIGTGGGKVRLVFFPRAKALCLDEFRQPVQDIPYQTWPRNREPLKDASTEIQFALTAEEWQTHRGTLYALTRAVYEVWESTGQDEGLPDSESDNPDSES